MRWIDEQDFRQGSGAPGLWFHHVVLPHEPWSLLDDRSSYEGRDEPLGLFIGTHWSVTGVDVARQLQVLQSQAVDAAGPAVRPAGRRHLRRDAHRPGR